MASALAFDTHAYVKRLQGAGVPEQQAEIQVEAIASLIEERMVTKRDHERLETELKRDLKELETELKRDLKELETELKRDLKELETELKRDLKELETELKRDFRELEMRLLIRLGALLMIGIGAIATLVKLL